MSRNTLMTLLLALTCGLSGCQWFPVNMRPSNWYKLNGQQPNGRDTMYFSVPDPELPEVVTLPSRRDPAAP
ncbi:MAG: hypothetical protein R3B90_14590 [Planctomycetaceae bacterium]